MTREIKFRAWAEKKTDNRWNYSSPKANLEWEVIKELKEEDNHDYFKIVSKYYKEWDKLHTEKELYTRTKEMITDIKVNGVVKKPDGYEIISVMQYTGLKDKN